MFTDIELELKTAKDRLELKKMQNKRLHFGEPMISNFEKHVLSGKFLSKIEEKL